MRQFLITLFLISVFSAAGQEIYEGRSIKKFTNGKDIYDQINKDARFKLMQEATYDAIEKGASIKINMATSNTVVDNVSSHDHFDQFISTTTRQYGVSWQRKSDYEFKLIDKRLWECRVRGLVIRSESGDIDLGKDQNLTERPEFTITKRGLNKVHISPSNNLFHGQLVGVAKDKKQRVLNDYDIYRKTKAIVYISRVEPGFAIGRIVKGFYNVKVGKPVITGHFKRNRTGFKLEYAPQTTYNTSATYFSASFYTESYISRWGFNLGTDLLVYDGTIDYESGNMIIPHVGVSYRIGLIPDVFFLIPEFNGGYVVLGESYDAESIVINPKIYVSLRLKFLEFMAGANYKYFVNDFYNQTGAFPFAGIRVNLNKNN